MLAGAGDDVMPDPMRLAVSPNGRHHERCGHSNVDSLYPAIAAHLMRVTDTVHWLEWQDWADAILSQPFQLKDGHLMAPDRPGQGIEWNEKAIARLAC